jgi:hypothetical protein
VSDYQEHETQSSETAGQTRRDPFNEFLRHQQRAVEETGKALEALLPPDFRTHSQEAGREFVSGLKVLFDAALDGVEKASRDFDKNFKRRADDDSDDRPSSTGATKVKVQVD